MTILKTKRVFILTVIFLTTIFNAFSQNWRSELYPYNWKPGFAKDGKFIQDFSYAGYKRGEQPVPVITKNIINVTQAPYNADNTGTRNATAAIQAAIDHVSGLGGGVVYLPTGTYNVQPNGSSTSCLSVLRDGVVIRGDGPTQTKILNTETNMRTKSIINFKPLVDADWYDSAATPVPFIKDAKEHETTIFVANASAFSIGDNVILTTDFTDEWIAEHNMTGKWNTKMSGVAFAREITNINSSTNSITVDIPIRYFLKTRDNARLYKVKKQLSECGLESLSIGNLQNNTATGWGDEDYLVPGTGAYEVHHAHAILMQDAKNCWIKNVSSFKPAANTLDIHILSDFIRINMCSLITIDSCDLMKPQYEGGGGNGYMYIIESNDCLISNSKAEHSRHNYSITNTYSNGNVFYKCLGKDGHLPTDFHKWFSVTNLFDNQICDGDAIAATYRGAGGTPEHGQTTTQSVIWNTNGLKYLTPYNYIIRSGQWGQGYVIGTRGAASDVLLTTINTNNTAPTDHLEGEGRGATLRPASLYIDQLNRRLNGLGSIDSFGMTANIIPQVSLIEPLDDTTTDLSTAVTISATASDANGSITKVEFYRGTTLIGTDTTAPYSINWTPATAATFIITARAFDNNGAINNSAPASVIVNAAATNTLNPIADSYVAGGTSADTNYGTDTSLIIRNNTSNISGTRKSIVKFDVTGQTRIRKAVVRLYARFGGPNSITAYQTTDAWTELGVTWNNMPALGTQMTTMTINAVGYWEWDVTSYVQSQATGDGAVSLIFQDDTLDNIQLGINSKEFGTNLPQLVLTKSTNIKPTISLTAPSSGTAFDVSTAVILSALAADTDGSIAKVDFYQGTTLLGSDSTSPYSFSWTPTLSNIYVIQAKTIDNDGASASSIISYVDIKDPVTTTINPIADSYIQAGTSANVNYGTDGTLIIMNGSPSINTLRKAILKFDVTGRTGIQRAVVRLFTRFGTPNSITAYQTADGWTEAGVTWNNSPVAGTRIGTTSITASGYREWDVTSYVQSQAAGDGIVSLLFQDDAVGNLQLGLNSKEFGSNLPELVITGETNLSLGNSDYNKNELVIYPVPVKDKINVILPPNNKSKMIQLHNSFGQIVLQKTILGSDDAVSVDISNLSAGLYLLHLIGEQNLIKKVIKQ